MNPYPPVAFMIAVVLLALLGLVDVLLWLFNAATHLRWVP